MAEQQLEELWSSFLIECSVVSSQLEFTYRHYQIKTFSYLYSFLQEQVTLLTIFHTIDGDTVRLFSHDNEIMRSFDVVNSQDIYLVRYPGPSDISVISKSNIRSFIHEQLLVGVLFIYKYSNLVIS